MITLILLGIFTVASLTIMFAAGIHGFAGAVILGIDALLVDIFWQWLRIKLVHKWQTGRIWLAIIGGLMIRVSSIYIFIRTGIGWLGNGKINSPVIVFTLCLLTIPIWNVIASFKLKSEGNE